MTLEEAVEVLMASSTTLTCTQCRGRGVVPGSNSYSREKGYEESSFCKQCNGARVVLNPIWKQAWLIVHPGDDQGLEARRMSSVTKAWTQRMLDK